MELVEETPYRFRIDRHGDMRVPGVVFASHRLLPSAGDGALEQVVNVATLRGIVGASYAMPDMHWGYGFPIGGVAATDVARGGVVSPGGVGFDISCGVRLLAADLDRADFRRFGERIMDGLGRATPRGPGRGAVWQLPRAGLEHVLLEGSRYAVARGRGTQRDLERCEDGGALDNADPGQVSARAAARGLGQVGSLGSGNHFLEVQAVDEIYDRDVAETFGLHPDQVCVMIHCGSRGLGHQICTDHVRAMDATMADHSLTVPDRQLACAPVDSRAGRAYLGAMAAAANYARANRQVLGVAASDVLREITGHGLELVYDISHNMAKIEQHEVAGRQLTLCVHRKGATRALPPGHPDLPPSLRNAGQPVLIPGSMGTASYVLTGIPGGEAFFSTCHGAGRTQSRHQAVKSVDARALRRDLERGGILVRGSSARGLAEEAPTAYKDVDEVVAVAEGAGLCRRVARLVPLGVVKG
ncbi:RNA-splicing ligase RtcB [Saccharopolyspora subtropica]|uniref:tRNA-splicing ligase RtcB n=1 Tax=Saccharopolyspora thermophila TaxID=89367 RepID=A0A917JZ97_9PSEU|nr:RtcB family protein [Saccharopolyspora subtropica]GGI91380.1 RNA-splicing ligase RtcB [Saccharopolyspora subtropica]